MNRKLLKLPMLRVLTAEKNNQLKIEVYNVYSIIQFIILVF